MRAGLGAVLIPSAAAAASLLLMSMGWWSRNTTWPCEPAEPSEGKPRGLAAGGGILLERAVGPAEGPLARVSGGGRRLLERGRLEVKRGGLARAARRGSSWLAGASGGIVSSHEAERGESGGRCAPAAAASKAAV